MAQFIPQSGTKFFANHTDYITELFSQTIPLCGRFGSYENFEEGERRGLDLFIPDKRKEVEERGNTSKGEYDRSHFEYNKEEDNYKCPEGKILTKERAIRGVDGNYIFQYFCLCGL